MGTERHVGAFAHVLWGCQERPEPPRENGGAFPRAGGGALKNEGLWFAHGKREPLFLRMTDYLINCDLRELKC